MHSPGFAERHVMSRLWLQQLKHQELCQLNQHLHFLPIIQFHSIPKSRLNVCANSKSTKISIPSNNTVNVVPFNSFAAVFVSGFFHQNISSKITKRRFIHLFHPRYCSRNAHGKQQNVQFATRCFANDTI